MFAAYLLAGAIIYSPGMILTPSINRTAFLNVSYQRGFDAESPGPYFYRLSGGAYSNRAVGTYLTSIFSAELGIRVGGDSGPYGTVTTGFARIGQPDRLVSTNFQFLQGASLGLMDKNGAGLGVAFKHISNAGIKLPNFGYNFLALEVTLPLIY